MGGGGGGGMNIHEGKGLVKLHFLLTVNGSFSSRKVVYQPFR